MILLVPVAYLGPFALDLGPGSSPTYESRIVYAVLCLPWLALAARTLRIGVVLGPEGVTIRNVLRTRRLRWDEIERFEMGDWGGFALGVARLLDGSQVRAFALNPPYGLDPEEDPLILRLLDGLNAELERARAAGLAGPPREPESALPRAPEAGPPSTVEPF